LWFSRNLLITGVDVNFSPFPWERFFERLYAWYPKVAGGSDRSNNFSSLPYIAIQAILSLLPIDIITVEKLSYVFWMFFSGLAMYWMITSFIDNSFKYKSLTGLFGSVIYMFNFYQPFLWVRLQLAVAALVLFPIFLSIIHQIYNSKLSLIKSSFYIVCISFIAAPIGIQPPLIYAMLLMLVFFIIYESLLKLRSESVRTIFFKFVTSIMLIVLFFIGGSFWFIPLISFIIFSGYINTGVGLEVYSVNKLLEWVSKSTSFLNIFRLFGDVSYFESWGGERYLEMFKIYETNPILIFLSFLLPLLVFGSFLFYKKNNYIRFFIIIVLGSLFLSKGTHQPFGGIYSWLIKHAPSFWIQRAPWQKFTAITIIGYAFLGGFFIVQLFDLFVKFISSRFKNRNLLLLKFVPYIILIILLITLVGFNFFFLFGHMFPSNDRGTGFNHKYNLSFHIKFPDYIYELKSKINLEKDYYKILLLPDDKTNVYSWGYGGTADITDILFNKGIIQRLYGEGYAPPQTVELLYQLFINELYYGNSTDPILLRLLGVKYILQRNDFRYNFYGDTDSPYFIKQALKKYKDITLAFSKGKWDLYRIDKTYPMVYVPQTNIVYNEVESIYSLNKIPIEPKNMIGLFSDSSSSDEILYDWKIDTSVGLYNVSVSDGNQFKFDWRENEKRPDKTVIYSRYYKDSKVIIGTKNNEENDTLSFDNSRRWTGFDSTLIFLVTGKEPFIIESIIENNNQLSDIIGVWWKKNWIGAGSMREVNFPIVIPPHQKVIIQVGHIITGQLQIRSLFDKISHIQSSTLNQVNPTITFDRVSPVKYKVKILHSKKSFPLIFLEGYHSGWKAYINNESSNKISFLNTWFLKEINSKYHTYANSYANAWFINPQEICDSSFCSRNSDGTYNMNLILEFWPQRLFYIGIVISVLALMISGGLVLYERKKRN